MVQKCTKQPTSESQMQASACRFTTSGGLGVCNPCIKVHLTLSCASHTTWNLHIHLSTDQGRNATMGSEAVFCPKSLSTAARMMFFLDLPIQIRPSAPKGPDRSAAAVEEHLVEAAVDLHVTIDIDLISIR